MGITYLLREAKKPTSELEGHRFASGNHLEHVLIVYYKKLISVDIW